ncbi:MAG: hypothetical protein M1830_006585 [Pleopsidium flavum]|nr:MAG: hypothetical protein M1830_006585 [Pleopsidium flavum]
MEMSEALPPGDEHEVFTGWVQERGVKINGVAPASFAGRGLGIAAKRKIQVGEELIKVPSSALLTTSSIPAPFRALHGAITTHGLLASFLAFGHPEHLSQYAPWMATWPSPKDFAGSMPIMWSRSVTKTLSRNEYDTETLPSTLGVRPLPPAIGGHWSTIHLWDTLHQSNPGLLTKQEEKFKKDWTRVSSVISGADRGRYMYYWLIVNTRTFYYELPGKKRKMARDDCMALCPFADYFNHKDEGCDVAFVENGFVITSDRDYEPGEEIYVSYGTHNNDFLLTEYGFILPTNKWDSLLLDDLMLNHPTTWQQKKQLERAGYLGNYTLSSAGVCHRTQVAVRMQTLSPYYWRKYVAGADLPPEVRDESKADALIWGRLIEPYLREVESALERLRGEEGMVPEGVSAVLVRRWEQIGELLRVVAEGLREGRGVRLDKGEGL